MVGRGTDRGRRQGAFLAANLAGFSGGHKGRPQKDFASGMRLGSDQGWDRPVTPVQLVRQMVVVLKFGNEIAVVRDRMDELVVMGLDLFFFVVDRFQELLLLLSLLVDVVLVLGVALTSRFANPRDIVQVREVMGLVFDIVQGLQVVEIVLVMNIRRRSWSVGAKGQENGGEERVRLRKVRVRVSAIHVVRWKADGHFPILESHAGKGAVVEERCRQRVLEGGGRHRQCRSCRVDIWKKRGRKGAHDGYHQPGGSQPNIIGMGFRFHGHAFRYVDRLVVLKVWYETWRS